MDKKKKNLLYLKNRFVILIGAIGGLTYAVFAWGVDGYILQQNNGSVPWLKLAIGISPSVVIFFLAAWFSSRYNNMIIRSLIWIATAVIISFIVPAVSIQGTEYFIKAIYPNIAEQINYVIPESISGRLFIIIVMSIILCFIGGMLIEPAGDAFIKSSGIIGWMLPVFICIAFFGGAGYVADSNFNFQLRDQVQAVNQQINIASQINQASMTESQERLIRRFTKLNVPLDGPRRFIVASFDPISSQSVILINFDGSWASCTALNDVVGNCERILN